jgi:Rad3-related DNA helicase
MAESQLPKAASAILFSGTVDSLDEVDTSATLATITYGYSALLNSADEVFKN